MKFYKTINEFLYYPSMGEYKYTSPVLKLKRIVQISIVHSALLVWKSKLFSAED